MLIQEAEDQDICTVAAGELVCGTTNNADGKPDTLQELALAIAAAGGPAYDAAYDRTGPTPGASPRRSSTAPTG